MGHLIISVWWSLKTKFSSAKFVNIISTQNQAYDKIGSIMSQKCFHRQKKFKHLQQEVLCVRISYELFKESCSYYNLKKINKTEDK